MFSFTHSVDNCVVATTRLLQLLKIPVTASTIEQTIQEHPDYPSLLSIADSLKRWKLNAIAVKLTPEKLDEVPTPFIIHLKTRGGQFITVKLVTEEKIIYLDHNRKEKHFTKEELQQQWDNVVLLAEANETSGEANSKKALRKEWWNAAQIPIGLIVLFILGLIQVLKFNLPNYPGSLYYTALILFSFLGVLVAGLLLWHEYDRNNPLLQKVCSAGSGSGHHHGRTGCQAILGSKASKAIGNISWSEIGFIYFAGSYLYLLYRDNIFWKLWVYGRRRRTLYM